MAYKRKCFIFTKIVSLIFAYCQIKCSARLERFLHILTSTVYHCYAFSAIFETAYIKLQQIRASLLYTKKKISLKFMHKLHLLQ